MYSTAFPRNTAALTLHGAAGAIEAMVEWPATPALPETVGVICHPHPLHGGTMSNKVVTTSAQALREQGCVTLRFNFRGVGASNGQHDDGRGEGDDLIAICAWLRRECPQSRLILAGFSFGAFVSMVRAAEIAPDLLISLAPAVGLRDFSAFREPACPWLVIQPDADEVVSPAAVYSWVAMRSPQPTLQRFAGASHFFHGRLLELRASVGDFVATRLSSMS